MEERMIKLRNPFLLLIQIFLKNILITAEVVVVAEAVFQ
jgi:hypothetical protein